MNELRLFDTYNIQNRNNDEAQSFQVILVSKQFDNQHQDAVKAGHSISYHEKPAVSDINHQPYIK